jgi:predicted N-acyltransferase
VEVAAALIAQGQQIAQQSKSKSLTLHDTRQAWPLDLPTSSHHVYWLMSLPREVETMWESLDSNIRRQVRIARRNGLRVTLDRTGQELAAFYEVFSRFTHHSGTPVFGRNFLKQVIATFPDDFNIAVVYQAQQPIGAYFQLQMGQTMYGVWGASLRNYLALRPAYLAHWEILSEACLRGFRYLDMGRSPTGSNAAHYKKQWGGVSYPIYQQVTSFGEQPAEAIASRVQTNGKMQMMRRLWPKLPLSLAQYLGPKLRRHVPFS